MYLRLEIYTYPYTIHIYTAYHGRLLTYNGILCTPYWKINKSSMRILFGLLTKLLLVLLPIEFGCSGIDVQYMVRNEQR